MIFLVSGRSVVRDSWKATDGSAPPTPDSHSARLGSAGRCGHYPRRHRQQQRTHFQNVKGKQRTQRIGGGEQKYTCGDSTFLILQHFFFLAIGQPFSLSLSLFFSLASPIRTIDKPNNTRFRTKRQQLSLGSRGTYFAAGSILR